MVANFAKMHKTDTRRLVSKNSQAGHIIYVYMPFEFIGEAFGAITHDEAQK